MNEKFVADRITKLRMIKGISEQQMSYELGMSKTYIWTICAGKAQPSLPALLSICEYFEITPAEFFEPMLNEENTETFKTLCELDEEDRRFVMRLIHTIIAEKKLRKQMPETK